MNDAERKNLIRSFFQALPEAGSTDRRQNNQFYVDRQFGGTTSDPVEELHLQITMAATAGSYLFSGLRGSGKTTELVRLAEKLEEEDGCIVFYVDIANYINLRVPLGIEDTIFAMLGALSDEYQKRFAKDATRESYWTRAANFLTRSSINVGGWSIKAGASDVGLELKGSLNTEPSFRQNLRKALSESADLFLRDAREYADEIVRAARRNLQQSDATPVILIVDSLERVSAATGDEGKMFDGLKEIFFNQREKLRFPTLTIIYSVPPYLDAVIPGVAGGFAGGMTFGLPHFKVIARESVDQQHAAGIDLMVAAIGKRFPNWEQVIKRQHVKALAFQSGGNMRRFFNLTRELLIKLQLSSAPLPLDAEGDQLLGAVLSAAREPYQWLSEQDLKWLARVAAENQVRTDTDADLPVILRLFDTSLILDYRNGERWYQVLPLVRPLLTTSVTTALPVLPATLPTT